MLQLAFVGFKMNDYWTWCLKIALCVFKRLLYKVAGRHDVYQHRTVEWTQFVQPSSLSLSLFFERGCVTTQCRSNWTSRQSQSTLVHFSINPQEKKTNSYHLSLVICVFVVLLKCVWTLKLCWWSQTWVLFLFCFFEIAYQKKDFDSANCELCCAVGDSIRSFLIVYRSNW